MPADLTDREIDEAKPAATELLSDIQWLRQEAESSGFSDVPPFGPVWLGKETATKLISDRQVVAISRRYLRAIERDLLALLATRKELADLREKMAGLAGELDSQSARDFKNGDSDWLVRSRIADRLREIGGGE